MPVYKFSAPITVSAYTEVEADSLDDAKRIAADRGAVIGGPGSGYDVSEHWVIEDVDGEIDMKDASAGED